MVFSGICLESESGKEVFLRIIDDFLEEDLSKYSALYFCDILLRTCMVSIKY